MSDGVIITIDMTIKPELTEQVCAGIPAMFDATRGFAGFRSIRVVRNKVEPNRLLIVEHWDSEADYQAYQAWRNEGGEMDAAKANLIAYRSEVWPGLVGAAMA